MTRAYIAVRLTLVPAEAGGRTGGIVTGYRPDWHIGNTGENGKPELNGASVEVPGGKTLLPGDTAQVILYPLVPSLWWDVAVGAVIALHDGPLVVGSAIVDEVNL